MLSGNVTITPAPGVWVVRAGGAVLAESARALEVREGDYPPEIFFPREDIGMEFLERTERAWASPKRGNATYFDVSASAGLILGAAWSFEAPLPGFERIAGYIAFDSDHAAIEQV